MKCFKRFLEVSVCLFLLHGIASANSVVLSQNLYGNSGVAVSTNVVLDMAANNVDYLSAQVVISSDEFKPCNFVDGTRAKNTITISSNTALSGATITFTYGNQSFRFRGVVDITTGTITQATTTFAAAINARPNLFLLASTSIYAASGGYGVIGITSTICGSSYNYTLSSSCSYGLSFDSLTFYGGTDPNLNYATSVFISSMDNYSYPLGLAVIISTPTGNKLPTSLVAQTTYYVIPITSSTFQLATSAANATKNTPIFFGENSSSGGYIFYMTPIAPSGTWTLAWQGSNDNANWYSVSTSTGVTYPYTKLNYLWSMSELDYRYIRGVFTTGTWGASNIAVPINGKRMVP